MDWTVGVQWSGASASCHRTADPIDRTPNADVRKRVAYGALHAVADIRQPRVAFAFVRKSPQEPTSGRTTTAVHGTLQPRRGEEPPGFLAERAAFAANRSKVHYHTRRRQDCEPVALPRSNWLLDSPHTQPPPPPGR